MKYKNYVSDKLVLSFWGYRLFGEQDIEETVKVWKDAFFNVGLSFINRPDENREKEMIKLLDCCEKYSLKLIIYDDRIHCHRLREMSEEAYENAVINSVEKFASHPATAAFLISDEPDKNTLPLVGKALEILRKHTDIPGFVNFFPMWRSKDYVDLMGVEGENIDKLYVDFGKKYGQGVIAYDCYDSMNARAPEYSPNGHFDNLNTYYKIAKELNVPLWTSLLCTGHMTFRMPTLIDFRWQLATALAHGVTGIQWFMLYDGKSKCGDSPIDLYNERQPTYWDLRKVQREFMTDVGDLICDLELEEVNHLPFVYGGTSAYVDGLDKYLEHFSEDYRDFAIISRFRHKETGNVWYMFVNGSRVAGNRFKYKFREPYEHSSGEAWVDPGRFQLIELRGKE